jgi:HTH-type transcriptional regulator/antitoxin HigA
MRDRVLDYRRPHLLRNDREYDAAISSLDSLLDRGRVSREEEERLELLTLLVEAFDLEHYPIEYTSPPQAIIDFLLEQNAIRRMDLAPLMGGASRVSDFFNGKRALSLGQIRKLRDRFNILADLLIERAPARRNCRRCSVR